MLPGSRQEHELAKPQVDTVENSPLAAAALSQLPVLILGSGPRIAISDFSRKARNPFSYVEGSRFLKKFFFK